MIQGDTPKLLDKLEHWEFQPSTARRNGVTDNREQPFRGQTIDHKKDEVCQAAVIGEEAQTQPNNQPTSWASQNLRTPHRPRQPAHLSRRNRWRLKTTTSSPTTNNDKTGSWPGQRPPSDLLSLTHPANAYLLDACVLLPSGRRRPLKPRANVCLLDQLVSDTLRKAKRRNDPWSKMPANLKDLPENIARAVKLSRSFMPTTAYTPVTPVPLDPRVTSWAKRVIEDGRLAETLKQIANNDPDLAN